MSTTTRKIMLSVEPDGNRRRVVAREVDSTNPSQPIPGSDGSIEDRPLSQLEWLHYNVGPEVFHLQFYFKGKKNSADWPFADPDMPGQPGDRFINVGPNEPVLTQLKNNFTSGYLWWAYKVSVPGTDIISLDPMIIIRNKSIYSYLLVAGIGFAAGVATTLLLPLLTGNSAAG